MCLLLGLLWRLMHNKLPTDENLKLRGCSMPSICSQCWLKKDSIFHLFFCVLLQLTFGLGFLRFLIARSLFLAQLMFGNYAIKVGVRNAWWLFRPSLWIPFTPFGTAETWRDSRMCQQLGGMLLLTSKLHNVFFPEIYGALRAIEMAQQHQRQHLWLEIDSSLVVKVNIYPLVS